MNTYVQYDVLVLLFGSLVDFFLSCLKQALGWKYLG